MFAITTWKMISAESEHFTLKMVIHFCSSNLIVLTLLRVQFPARIELRLVTVATSQLARYLNKYLSCGLVPNTAAELRPKHRRIGPDSRRDRQLSGRGHVGHFPCQTSLVRCVYRWSYCTRGSANGFSCKRTRSAPCRFIGVSGPLQVFVSVMKIIGTAKPFVLTRLYADYRQHLRYSSGLGLVRCVNVYMVAFCCHRFADVELNRTGSLQVECGE